MKTTHLFLKIITPILFLLILIVACNKKKISPDNIIQQGNTTIEINAIYPNTLQIRLNNIINDPINLTVTLQLKDGQKKDIPIAIPAGHRHLQEAGNNLFINVWNYNQFLDSTRSGSSPSIDHTWEVSTVTIKSVTCPNPEYGFKVLTGADGWTLYQPTDPKTKVSFISNGDLVAYEDYDFRSNLNYFRPNLSKYSFQFFNWYLRMYSNNETFPLKKEKKIAIPLMTYYFNGQTFGSLPDGPTQIGNASTLQMTITKISDTHFDATFEGKIWGGRQPDTLFISQGKIENALLPINESNQ